MIILSLDGGGVRGVFTARLLQNLFQMKILDFNDIDLVAGTSTGGLLAMALSCGMNAGDIVDLYKKHGCEIFKKCPWRGLCTAKYQSVCLRQILTSVFGNYVFGDLQKHVVIPAYDLKKLNTKYGSPTASPKVYENYVGDIQMSLVDIGMATTAAPTLFPSDGSMVDGGVFANHPAMIALAQALHQGFSLDEIEIYSLGTGKSLRSWEGGDWGLVQWSTRIIPLLFEGMEDVVNYQCRHLLGNRFRRVNPVLPFRVDMDDMNAIDALVSFADQIAEGWTGWESQNYLTL